MNNKHNNKPNNKPTGAKLTFKEKFYNQFWVFSPKMGLHISLAFILYTCITFFTYKNLSMLIWSHYKRMHSYARKKQIILLDFYLNVSNAIYLFYYAHVYASKQNYLKHVFYKNNLLKIINIFSKKSALRCLKASFDCLKLFAVGFSILSLIALVFLYIQLALEVLPLAKIVFAWLSIFFFIYLLLSGFVFFLKRYNFSKFTTIIARFWKRSFNLFWLLEGFVFLCFIYLTFNSSSEVLYFYDYQSLFKTHLFSFRLFFFKLVLITAVILFTFVLLGNYNFLKPSAVFFYILIISSMLLYITWVEFTQFFHFINFCDYFTWNYNSDSYEWVLENEFRKTRVVNNYVLVCVVAKFWHLIIIVLIWFFTVNRLFENNDSREYLLGANLQNFIILYLLNWIAMYPWFKYILRKYLNVSYLWFCTQFREKFFTNFFNGFYTLLISLV